MIIFCGIYNLLFPDKKAVRQVKANATDDFQLSFDFGQKLRKLQIQ